MIRATYQRISIFMLMVSILVFVFLNNHSLLYLDEPLTMIKMRMSFKELLHLLYEKDIHLPVYFVFLKLWLSVFGDSVFAARCFSYLGLLACAFGGGAMMKKIYGEKTGLWFTALFLFLPASFWLSRTIRMYSWACFFCTMAFLSAQSALLNGEKKDIVLYAVYAFLGAWTHYYASLTCALIAVVYLFLSFGKDKTLFKKFFLADTVLFLLVCPQIRILFYQIPHTPFWIKEENVWEAYQTYFSVTNLTSFGEKLAFFLMSGLWIILFQFLLDENKHYKKDISAGMFIALLLYYIAFMASFLYRPVLVNRYLTPALGCLFFAFAIGISKDKRNEILFGTIILPVFFGIVFLQRDIVSNSPQPAFIQAIRENVTKNDIIVSTRYEDFFFLCYFLPEYNIRTINDYFSDYITTEKRFFHPSDIPSLSANQNVFIVGTDFLGLTGTTFFYETDEYLSGKPALLMLTKVTRKNEIP